LKNRLSRYYFVYRGHTMKIGIKLILIMILLSLVSISSVGITLLVQSQANITEMAYDNATSSAR
jgi:hypothetical protein